jgi:aerobic-type carbon monoxide dehydrogenase small subunit (CoxS/CutS family)
MMLDFDGLAVPFRSGQTLAAALWAIGQTVWRETAGRAEPRGYYCGDGFCYDCLVVVNGRGNVRACQTLAEPGMHVATQRGYGPL